MVSITLFSFQLELYLNEYQTIEAFFGILSSGYVKLRSTLININKKDNFFSKKFFRNHTSVQLVFWLSQSRRNMNWKSLLIITYLIISPVWKRSTIGLSFLTTFQWRSWLQLLIINTLSRYSKNYLNILRSSDVTNTLIVVYWIWNRAVE